MAGYKMKPSAETGTTGSYCRGTSCLTRLQLDVRLRVLQALGLTSELIPTHRLDEGTEGLVVIARTHAFASYFQTLLKRAGKSTPTFVSCFQSFLFLSAAPSVYLLALWQLRRAMIAYLVFE